MRFGIGDHPGNGHSYSLWDLCEEGREVLLSCRQQTAGEEDFPGKAVPEAP